MTSTSVFRIGLSDDVEYSLLPSLLRQLRMEAPQVSFVVRRTDHTILARQLSMGEVSLGVCHCRDLPANAKQKLLRSIRPTVLSANSYTETLDLNEYSNRPHVSVSINGETSDYIDSALGSIGRQRQVVLGVSQYSALKALIEDTDMLAVVPDYVAKAMIRQGGVRMDPVPMTLPALDLSMSWNSTLDNDPAERWLRSRVSHYLSENSGALIEITSMQKAA
jgi:LysR family transcriptional activator of mexEF-oprN operon